MQADSNTTEGDLAGAFADQITRCLQWPTKAPRERPARIKPMNHDLSYLRTEYARNKDIECYNIEEEEVKKKIEQEEECKQN